MSRIPAPPSAWSPRALQSAWHHVQAKCAVYERWLEAGYLTLAMASGLIADDLRSAGFIGDAAFSMDLWQRGDMGKVQLMIRLFPTAAALAPGSEAKRMAENSDCYFGVDK